jgi:hypothetical protein
LEKFPTLKPILVTLVVGVDEKIENPHFEAKSKPKIYC